MTDITLLIDDIDKLIELINADVPLSEIRPLAKRIYLSLGAYIQREGATATTQSALADLDTFRQTHVRLKQIFRLGDTNGQNHPHPIP